MSIGDVLAVYRGSDGDATKRLYAELEQLGPIGTIAVNLFRAQKCSERAKVYRGGGYRHEAYARKQWSMDNLCKALAQHAGTCSIRWGWKPDPSMAPDDPYRFVLYVDLPTGQMSFHGPRGNGPDYGGEWDGIPGQCPDRVCRWVARLLREPVRESA